MPFVKLVKNKAYFKKYQVKFRRRREGRTDYRQRHKLITQDKNKYGSPKYRLVVRFTNRYVLCQVIHAEIVGDKVLCAASSKELAKHGLTVGLKNYAASYCTGLLLARRLLKQIGLEEIYTGVEEPTGDVVSFHYSFNEKHGKGRTYFIDEKQLDASKGADSKKPFRCLLDVGIKNTTTGARVFGAMKGASDGGLDIPHSNKRFPGYSRDTKTFEAEVHKGHIMGNHVAEYMTEMEEDDEENYQKHFARYIAANLKDEDLEELYEKVHASIREDPDRAEIDTTDGQTHRIKGEEFTGSKKFRKNIKKTYAQRKADSSAKKAGLRKVEADEDMEEEENEEDDE